jgi:C-terminal processing protease CtpA/Prc
VLFVSLWFFLSPVYYTCDTLLNGGIDMMAPGRLVTKIYLIAALLCITLTLSVSTCGQSSPIRSDKVQSKPANLDFEEGDVGQVPLGWVSPTIEFGYTAKLIEENPKTGRRCVLLSSDPEAKPTGHGFGNVMQVIDAAPYRGKRVRFRGAVRAEANGREGKVQLWLRVDRSGSKRGFFDNTGDRLITSGQWQYYDIVGDIDEDAAVINIGMILIGKGKACLDSVSIEDLGELIILKEPPRVLSDRGLENMVAFTRLLGYVRHFHPSDEAAQTDWDSFAVEGVRAIEPAAGSTELVKRLEDIFRPIAPTLRIFMTGEKPPVIKELSPPADGASLQIISWRHHGFGNKNSSQPNRLYYSERVKKDLKEMPTDPGKLFITADLGGGVSCVLPLVLLVDEKGTLPRGTVDRKVAVKQVKYSGIDRATRLADVVLAWNVMQHFYPYFDVVKTDWNKALKDALTAAAENGDEAAFLQTMQRMIAELHDGHGNVFHSSDSGFYTIPAIWDWIEGRLVITHVAAEGAGGLQPGDIVLNVDGKPGRERLAEKETLISGATEQWRRYVALINLRRGDKDSEVKLDVETRSGERKSVLLRRSIPIRDLEEPRPAKITEIKPGIFYIDIERIVDGDFTAALPQLEKARGIIFDLRGYPQVSTLIIQHLADKPVNSARWNIPIVTTPDHKDMVEFDTNGRWTLEPKEPRLKAKIAFLTDGRAISYAESYMGIIEAYRLAEIVGEPTAGTNGDFNPFTLPGNYNVIWTGMKVLKHDGSQHHGVGILPTIPLSRTIKGVAERRDEQLERAIDVVSK